jgi:hypothetical protein
MNAVLCVTNTSNITFRGGSISNNSAGLHGALSLDKQANVTLDNMSCSDNSVQTPMLAAGGKGKASLQHTAAAATLLRSWLL